MAEFTATVQQVTPSIEVRINGTTDDVPVWESFVVSSALTIGDQVHVSIENHRVKLLSRLGGVPPSQGPAGPATYTWIRYADDASGGGMSDSPTGKTYIGLAHNKLDPTESNTAADYQWSLIQGPQGQTGATGAQGPATYTWIKYAPNGAPTNAQISDSPTGMTHIGLAHNKLTATESTVAADYQWAQIQGPAGQTGSTGATGPAGTFPEPTDTQLGTNLNPASAYTFRAVHLSWTDAMNLTAGWYEAQISTSATFASGVTTKVTKANEFLFDNLTPNDTTTYYTRVRSVASGNRVSGWWNAADQIVMRVQNADIGSLAADKITAGDITVQVNVAGAGGLLKSSNFATGTAGWQIKADGAAEFNNVTVRGNLDTRVSGSGVLVDKTSGDFKAYVPNSSGAGVVAALMESYTDTLTNSVGIRLHGPVIGSGGYGSGVGVSRRSRLRMNDDGVVELYGHFINIDAAQNIDLKGQVTANNNLYANTGLKIGSSSEADFIKNFGVLKKTQDTSAVAATTSATFAFTFTGAGLAVGDAIAVLAGPELEASNRIKVVGAKVTAADTISVYVRNDAANAADIPSSEWVFLWVDVT